MRFCLELILATAVLGNLAAAGLPASPARATWVVKVDSRTGKLVRSLVAPPQARADAATEVQSLVADAAKTFDVNPLLVDSVIQVESNYNPFAVSPKGAQGLMQLIPATAQRFGVANVFNPVENIEGGAKYLRYLLDLYHDSFPLALAAYNAGERAVAKYGGVPPYSETRNYVTEVGKQFRAEQAESAKPKTSPKPVPDGAAHIVEIREPDGSVRYVSR